MHVEQGVIFFLYILMGMFYPLTHMFHPVDL